MQHKEGFKAKRHAQLLSLAWTFLFLQIKKLHANNHFSEELDQVLAQEDSVI